MGDMRAGGQRHLMPWFRDWCVEKAVKCRPRHIFTFIHIIFTVRRNGCCQLIWLEVLGSGVPWDLHTSSDPQYTPLAPSIEIYIMYL